MMPPGLTDADARLVPRQFREEAIQEAWVAYAEAKKNSEPVEEEVADVVEAYSQREAVRAIGRYVSRQRRRRRMVIPFSQLNYEDRQEVLDALGEIP